VLLSHILVKPGYPGGGNGGKKGEGKKRDGWKAEAKARFDTEGGCGDSAGERPAGETAGEP
jgi:hypothetical protein